MVVDYCIASKPVITIAAFTKRARNRAGANCAGPRRLVCQTGASRPDCVRPPISMTLLLSISSHCGVADESEEQRINLIGKRAGKGFEPAWRPVLLHDG